MKIKTKLSQIDTKLYQSDIAEQKRIDNGFSGKQINLKEKIANIKLGSKL